MPSRPAPSAKDSLRQRLRNAAQGYRNAKRMADLSDNSPNIYHHPERAYYIGTTESRKDPARGRVRRKVEPAHTDVVTRDSSVLRNEAERYRQEAKRLRKKITGEK